MARETLKDYLIDIEKSDADRINYKVNKTGGTPGVIGGDVIPDDGLGIDPNTGVEIIGFGEDQGIASGYLRFSTEGKNFYEFDPAPGSKPTLPGHRGHDLTEADLFIEGDPFVTQGEDLDNELSKYSNSRYFDNPDTPFDDLSTIIDKVGGTVLGPGDQARGANDLLKGVEDESDFVVKASIEALQRNNRFSIENEYVEDTFPANSNIDSKRNLTIPGYSGIDEDNDGEIDRITSSTSFRNLKNIGASLLLRSTGYDVSIQPGNNVGVVRSISNIIPAGNLEESLLTNKKIVSSLNAMNATGFPSVSETGESVRAGTGVNMEYNDSVSTHNASSFGSTYNDSIRFQDFSRAQRFKTAFRLVALVSVVKELFNQIASDLSQIEFQDIKEDIEEIAKKSDKVQAGKLILGLSRKSTKFVAKNYFLNNVLTPTDFKYEECFSEGLYTLFGNKISDELTLDSLEENTGNNARKENRLDFSDAPGYWHAVSNTILNSLNDVRKNIGNIGLPDSGDTRSEKLAISKLVDVDESRLLRIMNVIAIVGERSLHSKNAVKRANLKQVKLTRDPDRLPNLPGHRVGKSRIGKQNIPDSDRGPEIGSETTLAWEQSSVPSMYILPVNIIRAAQVLNNSFSGENPLNGMLGSRMVRNTYTGLDTDGTAARIPNRVVKIVEDQLDAEYVPFYFHDLRTNEIVAFHAFLHQLTDTISPSYGTTNSFGRIDPVLGYQGTSRNLNVGFTVYSTNREDYDEMWYKINKFVTMLYPQWTKGSLVQRDSTEVDGRSSVFYQPFSQVVGASPLIRLRIGDVIKSNYSRFGIARTFGLGDPEVKPRIDENIPSLQSNKLFGDVVANVLAAIREALVSILIAVYGSPQAALQMISNSIESSIDATLGKVAAGAATDAGASALAQFLVNGYVSPLAVNNIITGLKDPNTAGRGVGPAQKNAFKYLIPNFVDGYFCEDDNKTYFTTKRLLVKVDKVVEDARGKFAYKALVKDESSGDALAGKTLLVRHEDILNDPLRTFSSSLGGILFAVGSLDAAGALTLAARSAFGDGKSPDALNGTVNAATSLVRLFVENPEATFMRPEVNPFVKAYHSSRGRGLAGFIKGVSFDWLEDDIPWETDYNARAPIGCKITFSFDVIHDLPPGLDHSGYNRAPLYNVGQVMKTIAGDPYDETISESELIFRKAGKNGSFKEGKQFRVSGDIKGKK